MIFSQNKEKKNSGKEAEDYAEKFLVGKGLRKKIRNYQCRGGEIDLIMLDEDVTVFVEVKMRSRSSFGSAAEMVTLAKQKKIRLAAQHYLQEYNESDAACRFDVVAIDGWGAEEKISLSWHRAAFE